MLFAILLGCLAVASAQQTAPIPLLDTDPGIRLDPSSVGAPVKLEAFIELLCSDSAYAYPILKELQEHYGPNNLDVVINQLALPYHRQAQLTVQGLYYVIDVDEQNAIPYMDAVFADYAQLTNGATRELNENQVVDVLAAIQESGTGISAQDFAANVYGYGSPAIRVWKYATRRGMAGTPWFVVNNIDMAVNPGIRLSYDDWRAILDPLMPAKTQKEDVEESVNEIPKAEGAADISDVANEKEIQTDKHQLKEKAKKLASLKLMNVLKGH